MPSNGRTSTPPTNNSSFSPQYPPVSASELHCLPHRAQVNQQGAIAFNLLQGTGIVAIENGYVIREAAKAQGAKYLSGGVGEVIKPKS